MTTLLILTALILMKGVQKRDKFSTIPYLIVSGVCIFCYFLQAFTGEFWIILWSWISIIIQINGFVTVSSLYHKFDGECHESFSGGKYEAI
jgi:hypothetical protein